MGIGFNEDLIPELSEQRMVGLAPNRPIDFGPDRDYVFACLHDVEASFGLQGFPGRYPPLWGNGEITGFLQIDHCADARYDHPTIGKDILRRVAL